MSKKRASITHCPHCKASAFVRSSESLTPTVREARMICSNDACGHVFIAEVTVVRTLLPSMTPAPGISIPLSVVLRRQARQPGNDNEPTPANDDCDHPAAAHMTDN